ncbi:oligopeptide:H+ symporter [Chromobacterium sp. IIBBL 290-4]|uniref:POT-type proton-dependent oligopeptide transporter n=1 Tax=Chromobacterium sp. IIBBL 290-4 TaxID=2953890 RepID=UPI0020B68EA2|nr:oligopeptide:H+ symporter [Chromobacterium sp. IIBBL 290-4]UTH76184.1 oligopeptide:H+ symporter [Chromobacterium sp. IIBBL 290-4]
MTTVTTQAPAGSGGMPRQIAYIIGNEGCERFSFYGMRNILTAFLTTSLLLYLPEEMRAGEAKHIFHNFMIGVYFFPLLGGWLADRLWGKYNTIVAFSLIYCVGHACLALFENNLTGFYTGLALIAIGSGGIKPCVSSFCGDQFDESNKHLAKIVFDSFYWIINFGSLFASLLMPIFLKSYGPSVAFGIPGVLMFIALLIFWMGRKHYTILPPAPKDPHSFWQVLKSGILSPANGRRGGWLFAAGVALAIYGSLNLGQGLVAGFCLAFVLVLFSASLAAWWQLDALRGQHPDEALQGVRAVLRILVVFALATPFFSLFDQKASTWVIQAGLMSKPEWFAPSQMQALNPALVMLLIPFNNMVLYPALRRAGIEPTALRRMTAGIVFSALAWIVVGMMQLHLDSGDALTIAWQILPYALLTMGEVLVSATGLEFAYSQAPLSMKGTLMSFWGLSTTVGNLWVLLINAGVASSAMKSTVAASGLSLEAFLMFFFAGIAFVAAALFGLYARNYRMLSHYRSA